MRHQLQTPQKLGQQQKRIVDFLRSVFTKRCWAVVAPIILLNAVLTINSLMAQNNDKIYSVTVNHEALVAMGIQDDGGDSGEQLSETLRAHWIAANKDGNIEGRISAIEPSKSSLVPIEELDVTLLQKGDEKYNATTDAEGKFQLEDVEPGIYTLVASGQSGFLAYGVHVLPSLEVFDVLEQDAEFNPAPENYEAEKRAFYVSHFGLPQDADLDQEIQIDAAAVPPEFNTLQRISQNYLPAAEAFALGRDVDDMKAIKKSVEIRHGFKFPLAEDGSFNGRIQPIATDDGRLTKVREMNLFLIQDDLEVARVAAEENGVFRIEDVEPGVYALIAAGKDGFAAMSVELVGNESDAGDQGVAPPAMDIDGQLNTRNATPASAPTTHFVSTHPHPAAPSPTGASATKKDIQNAIQLLGVAYVSDEDAIKFLQRRIKRIADLRRELLNRAAQLGNPAPGAQFGGGGFGGGGFGGAPGGFGGAPGGFAPAGAAPAGGFGGGAPLATGSSFGGLRGLLPFAAIAGGAAALGSSSNDNDPVDPPDISTSRVLIAPPITDTPITDTQ